MMADDKKIIIDEDWKQQAQKEKETLKAQEKQEHENAEHPHPELPEADFPSLVSLLATQAFYALGVIRPDGDKDQDIEPDWAMAKFNIDLLGMLEDKCKGNLADDEAQLLKGTLDQLRMMFVQLSKKD
jgi:hypothetical protein